MNPDRTGTNSAALYDRTLAPGETLTLTLRLAEGTRTASLGKDVERTFAQRRAEADAFHAARLPDGPPEDRRQIARQALAGMIWSKQYFHHAVADWLDGDQMPPPTAATGAATPPGGTSTPATVESHYLNTAADAVRFVEDVGLPNARVHLDTFHMLREEDDLGAAIRATGDRLGYFHACGSHRGVPGRDMSPGPKASPR